MNEPELSRWWRYYALTSENEIQSDILEIEGDIDGRSIYTRMDRLRVELAKDGLRFVQAKPIAETEVSILKRLLSTKRQRDRRLQPPVGKQYRSFATIWLVPPIIALVALAWFLLRR